MADQTKSPILLDEEARIDKYRSTATWMLGALGAIAGVALANVALNKLPNIGDPKTGLAAIFGGIGGIIALISLSKMIYDVGQVLIIPHVSLRDLAAKTTNNREWFNRSSIFQGQHSSLTGFIQSYDLAVIQAQQNTNPAQRQMARYRIKNFFIPIIDNLNIMSRRFAIGDAYSTAIDTLQLGSIAVAVGVVLYIGANAYAIPSAPPAPPAQFALPSKGLWTPIYGQLFSIEKKSQHLADLHKELGGKCDVTKNVNVIVLATSVADKDMTYDVLVNQKDCNLARRSITVPGQDGKVSPPSI
jgi:hypothetical protein